MAGVARHVWWPDRHPARCHAGLHWHPNTNEWNYVLAGRAEVALYGARGRGPVAEFAAGEVAYFPRGFGHAIRNVGAIPLKIVQVWDADRFEEITLAGMLAAAPAALSGLTSFL